MAARQSRPCRASRLPHREQNSRLCHSDTGVSGPYRLAISPGEAICDGSVRSFAAGSALVPPSAARSDAVAGSTRYRHSRHPAKPRGSRRSREARRRRGSPKGEAPHDQPNMGLDAKRPNSGLSPRSSAAFPSVNGRAGIGFHLTASTVLVAVSSVFGTTFSDKIKVFLHSGHSQSAPTWISSSNRTITNSHSGVRHLKC